MKKQYDIIVAGGGMSGVAAAVAAARLGRSVLLVERNGALGGLGTLGLLNMILGPRNGFGGIGLEIMDYLRKTGGSVCGNSFDVEHMKRALDKIVSESGADILMYAMITGVKRDSHGLTGLELFGQTGFFTVEGKYFVDATGDAMLAYLGGEPVELGGENGDTQAPTMVCSYINVDFAKYSAFLERYGGDNVAMIRDTLPKAVAAGDVGELDFHHPGPFKINDTVTMVNAGHVYGADCLTSEGLTSATIKGRRQADEYFRFYKKYIPGFENSYLVSTGSVIGIRETRRINGKYTMTFEDKVAFKKFDDAIMRMDGGSTSDVHASSPDKDAYAAYYNLFTNNDVNRPDDWATLPYRSLLAQNAGNLLAAGRCVSTDRKVQGQIRVMAHCFMMGQAAGTGAALAAGKGSDAGGINIVELQSILRKNGIENI